MCIFCFFEGINSDYNKFCYHRRIASQILYLSLKLCQVSYYTAEISNLACYFLSLLIMVFVTDYNSGLSR